MFRSNIAFPAAWTAPVLTPPNKNDYNTGYSYDPNGNINTLGRAQNGKAVDIFNYNYTSGTNQLKSINDGANSAEFSDDIDNQTNPNTYTYDASGNQITDVAINNIQWTVDGKVKAVNGTASQIAKYVYDASGNRVMKQTPVMNTIYARDANSQVMAIYESGYFDPSVDTDPSVTPCINISIKEEDYGSNCTMNYTICGNDYSYDMNTGIVTITAQITSTNLCFGVHKYLQPPIKILLNPVSLAIDGIQTTTGDMPYVTASMSQTFTVFDISKMPKLSEWHIYGNEQQGRFSVRKPEKDPITDPLYYLDALTNDVTKKNFFRILDKKQYELKDHLGNVRVAIGDMKIPTAVRGVAPFVVDEKSVSDFYPGGMSISDRSWQGTSYRYGYNSQEKSLEIDASGNHHTAEFWEVNNASLRRWNLDPKPTIGISQYSIFENNPILFNDLLGDSPDKYSRKHSDITNSVIGFSLGFIHDGKDIVLGIVDLLNNPKKVNYAIDNAAKEISKVMNGDYRPVTKTIIKVSKAIVKTQKIIKKVM